jgi:hypothetical protein
LPRHLKAVQTIWRRLTAGYKRTVDTRGFRSISTIFLSIK